jgi:hypothetical protein
MPPCELRHVSAYSFRPQYALAVPIVCELVVDGRAVTLPDPAGDTFDAAGGFDRLLPIRGALPPDPTSDVPVLSRIDPDGEVEFTVKDIKAISAEIGILLARAKPGVETRGLNRLRVLVDHGRHVPGAVLRVLGD